MCDRVKVGNRCGKNGLLTILMKNKKKLDLVLAIHVTAMMLCNKDLPNLKDVSWHISS